MAPDNFVKTGPVPSVRDLRWRADARPSPDFYRLWVDWFFDPGKPGSRARSGATKAGWEPTRTASHSLKKNKDSTSSGG